MAYVTASEFIAIPATSDGCTLPVAVRSSDFAVACFCDCGCGNRATDDFCESCYTVCLGEPCDCSLTDKRGFFKIHACGAEGCECNPNGSLREPRDPETVAWMALPF